MDIFLLVVEDWSEVKPPVEPFVLVLSLDQVEEIFLFQISELNVTCGIIKVHTLLGVPDLLVYNHLFINMRQALILLLVLFGKSLCLFIDPTLH